MKKLCGERLREGRGRGLSEAVIFLSFLTRRGHQAGHFRPLTAFMSPHTSKATARARRSSVNLVAQDMAGT